MNENDERCCVKCGRAWYLGDDFWGVAWDTPPDCDHKAPRGPLPDYAEEEEAALRSILETLTRSES